MMAPSRVRDLLQKLVLLVGSSVLLLLLLEAGFRVFDVRSDNFVLTLASQRWEARYWKPINSRGYRDVEHGPGDAVGQRVLAVVGDSFTAGAGIEDPRDRFPDVLAALLGPGWRVVNIARGGWSQPQELRALKAYPLRPDAIVLQYYINDIRSAARKHRAKPMAHLRRPRGSLGAVVETSSFVNFVYWRLYRLRIKGSARTFWEGIRQHYEDKRIWSEHVRELEDFVRYARQLEADLVVVLFPFLPRVEETAPITAKVAGAFEAMGVEVLDLAPVFAGRSPSDLIVHSMDAHPNARVHREVAELLWKTGSWSRP